MSGAVKPDPRVRRTKTGVQSSKPAAAVWIVPAGKPACKHRLKGVSGHSSENASFKILESGTDDPTLVERKACCAERCIR